VQPGAIDQQYLDFDLLVERHGEGFRARVLAAPVGAEAVVDFSIDISTDQLDALAMRMSGVRSRSRALNAQEVSLAKRVGVSLFTALFQGDVLTAFRNSYAFARNKEQGLRIKLRLSESPQLVNYPWELLYNVLDKRFLALYATSPIVRYIELKETLRVSPVILPLRILVAIASPTDFEPLDVMREWNGLLEATEKLRDLGIVIVEQLEKPTFSELEATLDKNTRYNIFHFIGHGGFDRSNEEGVLCFESASGRADMVNGEMLGAILRDQGITLAVLNACEGARTSYVDPFAGVAQSLVYCDIPAVVAMQFEISDEAAIRCSRAIYESLAAGATIDAAVSRARKKILASGKALEWATPVLYSRSPDGRVFDIRGAAKAAAVRIVQSDAAFSSTREEIESKAETDADSGPLDDLAAEPLAPSQPTIDSSVSSPTPSQRAWPPLRVPTTLAATLLGSKLMKPVVLFLTLTLLLIGIAVVVFLKAAQVSSVAPVAQDSAGPVFSITPVAQNSPGPVSSVTPAAQNSAGSVSNVAPKAGVLEFKWPGNDSWVILRGEQVVKMSSGSDKVTLQTGTYVVRPQFSAVFTPFKIQVLQGQTVSADAMAGVLDFKWPGNDSWVILRGEQVVKMSSGSDKVTLQAGTYVVRPQLSAVFTPFKIQVLQGQTVSADAMAGMLEFKWPGDDSWVILRGEQVVKMSSGSDKVTLQAGTYVVRPQFSAVFAPFKIQVLQGQTVRAP
jgi:hypothetical protein